MGQGVRESGRAERNGAANTLDSVVVAVICAIALEILVAFVFMGFPGNSNGRRRVEETGALNTCVDVLVCMFMGVCVCV